MGSQAGKFSARVRPCWKYLLSFSVLSSLKRVFNFEILWPNFRSKYQVSYLARTYYNDPLHSSWTMLCYFLGQDASNVTGNTNNLWDINTTLTVIHRDNNKFERIKKKLTSGIHNPQTFIADIHLEQSWHLKCGWSRSTARGISHVGYNLSSYKAEIFWAFLLYSSLVHCFCSLLCATCGIFLFLHNASRIIPFLDRPISKILTVAAENPVGFCSCFALWSCWAKFLQEPRWRLSLYESSIFGIRITPSSLPNLGCWIKLRPR